MNISNLLYQNKNNTETLLLTNDIKYSVGKYYINNINNYEYIHLKSGFDFIFIMMWIRFITLGFHLLFKLLFKKEFKIKIYDLITFQYFLFKIRKTYFEDWKNLFNNKIKFDDLFPIIEINPFMWLHEFVLILIEVRIIWIIIYLFL